MKLWQKYNQQQLQEFIDMSKSYKDFCSKMGYQRIYSKTLYEIKTFYPELDIQKFEKEQECNKKGYNPNFEDLTGQKFNYLTVLRQGSYSKGKLVRWICRCDCGNITSPIRAAHLKDGHTKSCGCLQSKKTQEISLDDLTNKRFGKLLVLKRADTFNKKIPYWTCQCDCGGITTVCSSSLKSGSTLSCGCLKSKGESLISNILKDNKIDYIKEYNFPDLLSENGNRLRFDFAVFEKNKIKCLIEYQGEQHFYPIEYFGGEKIYQKICKHDKKKVEYCQKNNIPLIILTYKDFDKIDFNFIFSKLR